MGVVYEAFDRETLMRVALKTIRILNPDAVLRFKREFRALRDLQHPNLVRLGELIEDQGQWFFTMELLEGVDFLSYVRPFDGDSSENASTQTDAVSSNAETRPVHASLAGPSAVIPVGPVLDEVRLRCALTQLVEALVELHHVGKVHRDIKPSNILVTNERRVVLLDFGLVADLGHQSMSNIAVGTADYMAPEQATSRQIDAAADWYSVGVVLYQALTGTLPFTGSIFEILKKKREQQPVPPRTVAPTAPPDLSELCLELLRVRPESRPAGPQLLSRFGLQVEAQPPRPRPSSWHKPHAPFVGRESELLTLRRAFEESRQGRPVTVLVSGESGIGKSRLVEHLIEALRTEIPQLVALAGRCHEREAVPYKALDGVVDGLAHFIGRLADPEAAALLPRRIDLLANVFPVLQKVRVVAQAPRPRGSILNPQELRIHVLAAFVELLGRLCERYPLVAAIDDFQWADIDSLAFLGEVMRSPDAPALLLIVTMRTAADEKPGPPALLAWGARTLAVRGLPELQASQLAALLMRSLADASTSTPESIAKEAGGHPLFIEEMVHHIQTAPGPAHGRMHLEQALWSRISRLDDAARRIMELVATAGAPVGQQIIAQAAQIDFAEFVEHVATLEASHLIRRSGARLADTVEAYHDRVSDAVLENLTAAAVREYHGRLAVALETAQRTDAETLAVHWREAGQPDRAVQYAIQAADQAAAALAFERAVRLYRLCLELVPLEEAAKRQALTVLLGDALTNAGRGTEAAGVYLAVASDADPVEALDLRRRAAEQLLRSGRLDEGIAVLSMAARAVGKKIATTPRRALLSVVIGRARMRLRGLRFQARSKAELTAESSLRMNICWAAAVGLGMTDTIRGAAFHLQYLLLALDLGQEAAIARGLAGQAIFIAAEGGKAARRAERMHARAQELAARLDDPLVSSWLLGCQAALAYLQGRWKDALAPCEGAERIFRERCTGVGWERFTAQLLTACSLSWLGELGELSRRVPMYLQEAEDRGDLYAAVNMCTGPPNLAWLVRDDVAGARRAATDALKRWSQKSFHVQHTDELYAQAQIDLYVGDGPGAYRRVASSWRALRGSYLLYCQLNRINMLHLRARGALAAAQAPGAEKEKLLRVATRDARRIARERMPWSNPLAELLLAGVAATRGQTERALELLRAAAAHAEAADMALHAAVARRHQGLLIGGDEGRQLVEPSEAWMRSQKVQNIAGMVAMLAPGFAR